MPRIQSLQTLEAQTTPQINFPYQLTTAEFRDTHFPRNLAAERPAAYRYSTSQMHQRSGSLIAHQAPPSPRQWSLLLKRPTFGLNSRALKRTDSDSLRSRRSLIPHPVGETHSLHSQT